MTANGFRKYWTCYLFLLPNGLLFLALTAVPVLCSFLLAFFDWGGKELDLATFGFAGLSNFAELARTLDFWYYLSNTLFLMLGIPVSIAIHLGVALLMNRKLKEIVLYRTVWFLPSVAGGVAILLLWQWIFYPDGGLLNTILAGVGVRGPAWLQSEMWAKPAFMLMGWWTHAGGMGMILYLAALQGIPQTYYDAASIDGASAWQAFWNITWPMVSPTTFFMFITGCIGGFQAGFMNAYVLTGGGPNGTTTTVSFYIYQQAYVNFRMGYASAIAWVLFVFVAALTVVNWRVAGRRVHYQ